MADEPIDGARPDAAELRERLTDEQFQVTQCSATEPPFTGKLWDEKRSGTYSCVVCGVNLFDSATKYESGTGWPSFTEPDDESNVTTRLDTGHGMRRTEVLCGNCGAHLGHVFEDGPPPSGLRYCMNSAALDFEPRNE